MAVEQIRPDRRPEQWCGPRRKILMSAQGLRFFSESPAALLVLLFQHHATSEMRGCLRSRIVRAICLATPFRRQPWAGTEAEFVQDLQLHFAPALSGLSVEGAADRQGWRRSSRDPLHAHL